MKNSEVINGLFSNKNLRNKNARTKNLAVRDVEWGVKEVISYETQIAIKTEGFIFINATYFSITTNRHIKLLINNTNASSFQILKVKNLHLVDNKLHNLLELARSYLVQEVLKLNTEIYKARKTKELSNALNKISILSNIDIDLTKHRVTKVLRDKINKRERLLNTFKTIKLL